MTVVLDAHNEEAYDRACIAWNTTRACGRIRSTSTQTRITERHKWGQLRITLRELLLTAEGLVGKP